MKIVGNFIVGEALLTTKSVEEFELLSMTNPVEKSVSDFFNIGKDVPLMWVHDYTAVRIDVITDFYNIGYGYIRTETSNGTGYTYKCNFEQMLELMTEEK